MTAHHGNTPAAWTGVTIVFLGFVVGGLGLVLENMLLFWIGVVLAPIGGVVGYVMGRMGFGGTPLERDRAHGQPDVTA
jgi:asparagine N-glycosylation enzyme membrane subunit Stt3